MNRQHESKRALSALSNHWEAIDSACYESGGIIPNTEEGEVVSKALLSSKLAYLTDDDVGVQIHSAVKKVLNRATSSIRFREKHGEFSGFIESIDFAIGHYRSTKHNDVMHEEAFDEVRDIVVEMMDALTEATQMFHHVVNNEFSTVYDVDSKIQQITRCKNEVIRLNDILEKLSVKNLREWVVTDLRLEGLIMKRLKASVDEALNDIGVSNRKLVEMLLKIQRNEDRKKKNRIIDASKILLGDNGAFSNPLIDPDDLPDNLWVGGALEIGGYPSIYTNFDCEELNDIVQSVASQSQNNTPEPVIEKSNATEDSRGVTKSIEIDEIDETLEDLFSALGVGAIKDVVTSSGDIRERLELDIPVDEWLMLIATYISAQGKVSMPQYHVEYDSHVSMPLDGNLQVTDIKFVRK
ncbi:hypothetical protein ACED56_07335 [Vibrio splendidus]|uniref:hypothetical protein n=1 Tax=Vibrio splendidus TaxID=29497 RepID=UPI00352E1DCD